MKPILFNTEMVRAILEGRKTVTRRVINRDIVNGCDMESDGTLLNYENSYGDFINPVDLCRYRVGDVLYVRETIWQKTRHTLEVSGETVGYYCDEFLYAATDNEPEVGWSHSWVKRPSIHMPKAAARIFLRVTSVRVERLRDITDPEAEGIKVYPTLNDPEENYYKKLIAFSELWDSTIRKDQLTYYSWQANPYVWVIEFERVEKPEAAV